ncbi:MAG: SRPBCC family protein [Thermoanaerobaculia bacterium]|nr:SRPBCC family protein [Thermoanaerobaculia bacterium]
MRVRNVHRRDFSAAPESLGLLLDTLSSAEDRIWPLENWPRMRLDRQLGVGAAGGHGPIRYVVEAYEPGVSIIFRFTGPEGFNGTHTFAVEPRAEGASLSHVLTMDTSGKASLSWALIYRPLHDALVEEAFDRAAAAVGEPLAAPPWSLWVRMLRAIVRRPRARIMTKPVSLQ